MKGPTFWRVLIFLATLFCVTMLFAPLVRELLTRVMQFGGEEFP